MGVVRGESSTGRNCPRWELSGGKCQSGSCSLELFGRSCSVGVVLVGVVPLGVVRLGVVRLGGVRVGVIRLP